LRKPAHRCHPIVGQKRRRKEKRTSRYGARTRWAHEAGYAGTGGAGVGEGRSGGGIEQKEGER